MSWLPAVMRGGRGSTTFRHSPDLAPRERRIEVEERMQPDGTALVPLKADEIAQIVQAVAATGAEAVAVCFSIPMPTIRMNGLWARRFKLRT